MLKPMTRAKPRSRGNPNLIFLSKLLYFPIELVAYFSVSSSSCSKNRRKARENKLDHVDRDIEDPVVRLKIS